MELGISDVFALMPLSSQMICWEFAHQMISWGFAQPKLGIAHPQCKRPPPTEQHQPKLNNSLAFFFCGGELPFLCA